MRRPSRKCARSAAFKAIAISHPHYYSCMQDWASAFDAPRLSARRRSRMGDAAGSPFRFWDGDDFKLADGTTLLRLGGHFAGRRVLHWRDGAKGRGALFRGDTVQVAPHPQKVSFLWSYPNMMPLPAATIRRIAANSNRGRSSASMARLQEGSHRDAMLWFSSRRQDAAGQHRTQESYRGHVCTGRACYDESKRTRRLLLTCCI